MTNASSSDTKTKETNKRLVDESVNATFSKLTMCVRIAVEALAGRCAAEVGVAQ